MSYADYRFVTNCKHILNSSISDNEFDVRPKWSDGTPAHTKKILYAVDRYELDTDYIPVMTLRKTGFKNAIDEILWIYQKKSNKISDLNSHIWDSWDIGDGTIGKAYGYQIGKKSLYGTEYRDQIDQVIWDLKNNPASRSILTNTYCHEDLHEMGLRPCAYMMTFNVTKENGVLYLNGMLNQRSQDMLTANNWNVVQYSVLLQMIAQVVGMKPGKFVHVVADMHIYDRHEPIVRELLDKYDNAVAALYEKAVKDAYDINHVNDRLDNVESFKRSQLIAPHKNPTFWINPDIHDFYDFTVDDFKLINYAYEPFDHKIEVAV